MSGAASLLTANYVYKVAKPDGLTILNFHGNQVINQVIGKPGSNSMHASEPAQRDTEVKPVQST
jgi:hypothetical protein